ncbi:hypothetical protein TCDM_06051 [Trypanosoma cruzi Dm28c]|uniref:Uncharacterized protein n=1 Tax=Trypanosoma cruzi Dm28c TaxID=1416333 RepID=V5AXL0_TRYCR|nr:hypothetical protein TCDM_06051 [Trypanosoma cruzi Dm28c]
MRFCFEGEVPGAAVAGEWSLPAMGSPLDMKAAAWRSSTQTTPQTSPQHQRRRRLPQQQQGTPDMEGLFSLSSEMRERGKGLRFAPTTLGPQRRLTNSMKPAAETTTTTTTAAAPSVSSTAAVPSRSTPHFLPLHDRPAFLAELLHRTVFVYGFHTVEECRALLQLLQAKCGPIAGAFRTANHTRDGNDTSSWSYDSAAGGVGGCVVICVAFYRADSACMALRLDNTAQVFQKRFVVESATKLQHLSRSYTSMPVSSANSMRATPELPQHERLWLLLFSTTVGAAKIDWQAAAAAVGRGEALLLTSALFPAGLDKGVDDTTASVGFLTNRDTASASRYRTHLGFKPTAAGRDAEVGSSSSSGGGGGGDVTRTFDLAMNQTGSSTSTTPTTPAASAMPSTTAAATLDTTGCAADALGRSNTLQQQYYTTRYESSNIPFFSLMSRLSSLVMNRMNHGSSGGLSGTGTPYSEAYLPAPLRQRVDRAEGRYHDTTSAPGASTGKRTAAPGGVGETGDTFGSGEHATGVTYIPRMRSIGDYFIATLPFAAPLLTPLFRASADDRHLTAGGVNDGVGIGGAYGGDGNDNIGTVEELLSGGDTGRYEGHSLHTTGFASLRQKRPRYMDDGEVDGRNLRGMGGGFASLQPEMLTASFPSTAAASAATSRRPMSFLPAAARQNTPHGLGGEAGVGAPSTSSASTTSSMLPFANIHSAASNDAVRAYLTERVRLRSLPPRGVDGIPPPPPATFSSSSLSATMTKRAQGASHEARPAPSSALQELTSSFELSRLFRHARSFYERFR